MLVIKDYASIFYNCLIQLSFKIEYSHTQCILVVIFPTKMTNAQNISKDFEMNCKYYSYAACTYIIYYEAPYN